MLILFCSCENIVLWRGHFTATGAEKSVNISVNGGEGYLPSYIVDLYKVLTLLFPSIRCQCLGQRCILGDFLREVGSIPLPPMTMMLNIFIPKFDQQPQHSRRDRR